jgi:hypothetical protein
MLSALYLFSKDFATELTMSKISEQLKKKRDFFFGMIVAAFVSLMFWGLISLFYSGHSDTDYKLTPLLILPCLPVHALLLLIISTCFRKNKKQMKGFILGGQIAFLLAFGAMSLSGFVVAGNILVPMDTVPLLSLVFFAWILILLPFIFL